jgi:hypothetical protein
MRSRWLDLGALPALACLTEGLWLSIMAALIARVSWPFLLGVTLATMAVPAAATVAARAARLSTRVSRAVVGIGALGSVAALIGLQTHTPISRAAGLAVADMLFVVVASWLAIRAAEASVGVDEALGRAARGFGLVFLGLLFSRLAHQPFAAGGVAVTGVVAAAALLVALARWGESLTMTDRRYGVSGWTWLTGILATIAAILLVAAVLAALAHGAPLAWTFSAILDGLRYLLHALAFAAATVAYAVLRAVSWVLGLFHVHRPTWLQHSRLPHHGIPPLRHVTAHAGNGSTLLRDVAWPLLATIAGGVLLFLLVHAVRRISAGDSPEPLEERESLISESHLMGSARRRLSHLVARLPRRQAPPSSPAESVRRQFATLERSLATLGEARLPSQTARQYLVRIGPVYAAPPAEPAAGNLPDGADNMPERLITGYEKARYSEHPLSWQDAADFGRLARLYLEQRRAAAVEQLGVGRPRPSGV